MKKTPRILMFPIAFAALLALNSGCTTTNPGDISETTRVAANVRSLSQVGTYLFVRDHPSRKPVFRAVSAAIRLGVERDQVTPAQIKAIIAGLGLSERDAGDAVIAITAGLGLIEGFIKQPPPGIDQPSAFKVVVLALADGINDGLDITGTERGIRARGLP